MKFLAVFCVLLAWVSSVEMKKKEECVKDITDYKPQNDQAKDCPKFNEFRDCLVSEKKMLIVEALRVPELAALDVKFSEPEKKFSCILNCKEPIKAKACYATLIAAPPGGSNREATCKLFTEFAECVRKDGTCDAGQATEADKVADYVLRKYHNHYCRPCKKDSQLVGCRTKAAAVDGEKAKKAEVCKAYDAAKACFTSDAGCPSISASEEMIGVNKRLSDKDYSCETNCENFLGAAKCETEAILYLFGVDTNMASKDDVCKTKNDIADKCFKEAAVKCTGDQAAAEMNALKGYAKDLLGYECSGSGMAIASLLTVLTGAFLTVIRR